MKKSTMFVVAIVFVLAFMFTGCGKSAEEVNKENYREAMSAMKAIGWGIESYLTDSYEAPKAKTMDELEKILVPKHMKALPKTDPWGTFYLYEGRGDGTDKEKDLYKIHCLGADAKFGTADDITFENGSFK